MFEEVMFMEDNGMSKTSSVQGYDESSWLGRWTQPGNEVKFLDQRPEEKRPNQEHLPFPMFKVSKKRDNSTKDDVGSSSKAVVAHVDKEKFSSSNRRDFPVQEKTTQNLLELMRPVRFYATVDSVQRVSGEINLPEEDGHQLLKLKGKIFGGYLDLFPNVNHPHKGGVRLQSLESSKNVPRQNESSAETDILEMDKLQTIGSISSSSTKGKGRRGVSAIPRTEIPDMNEEPPLVLDGEGETSNSATQSMNVDHFLSRDCKRVRLEPEMEPSSRWVKRLKTTATSDSSDNNETKSLMNNEVAPRGQKGNNNNLFLEILKSGINNLQPRNQEPVTPEIKNLNQGGEDVTLLHPWIQRWCKKKATSTDQPEGQEVSFEPENQKELEKKQYPSIAAMALMGKALSGLNPYGLKKTDSLMVWNARDLR
ncbi:hypothetical protein N665_0044s0013 [Sinapis alba]|nr:hypothetical protein N665_0044s0013 [Sinapis alba]